MSDKINWEVGKRYILKKRYGTSLSEIEVVEVSEKAIKAKWNGQDKAHWTDKFMLSGETWSDYELYEVLNQKEDETK